MNENSYWVPFFGGAWAGICVDMAMYPIDTVKTRMQSEKGFLRAGGIRGVYSGLSAVLTGSMPGASLFFITYEVYQRHLRRYNATDTQAHVVAASAGEVCACLVRVPTEVVKQRAQVTEDHPRMVVAETVRKEGLGGLYRGYSVTICRDVPFAAIQFPLWERLKVEWARRDPERHIGGRESMICGFVAGGVAAAVTTPLDVAKTWIMLAKASDPMAKGNFFVAWRNIISQHGPRGLFRGIVPRTLQISFGGAVFLGVYDAARDFMSQYFVY